LATSGGEQISVILPNFNHGKFLQRSVSALVAQDAPPAEIVLIDDGSTDDSISIIDALANVHPSVRALRNPANIGLVPTQQRALGELSGQYIYLAAADDWVLPGFFSTALAMLRTYPHAGLFFGDSILIDGVTNRPLGLRPPVMPRFRTGAIEPGQVRQLLRRSDNWIVTGAALIRRDALLAAGGLDAELHSFADGFVVRKIALMRGVCYAPRPVMNWCVFPTGVSRQTALNIDNAQKMMAVSYRKMAADPVFPPGYADQFRDRWRFATARLALQKEPMDLAFATAIGARTNFDRAAIAWLSRHVGGRFGRFVLLLWLWLRLRPYRLIDLATTFAARRLWYRNAGRVG
jgi:glycosyltransferase involved in cell wall biosynthesis